MWCMWTSGLEGHRKLVREETKTITSVIPENIPMATVTISYTSAYSEKATCGYTAQCSVPVYPSLK